MKISNKNLFSATDFKTTLKKNFISLLNSVEGPKSALIRKDIEKILNINNNAKITVDSIKSLYKRTIKIVPNNKINKAKLQSIHQIILLNTRQCAPEEQDRQQKSLLNFVNQTLTTELLNFQIHLQNIKEEIENLKAEDNFMSLYINDKLAKLSRDLDDYIEKSIFLNDPTELDKRDKRMMRIVIDEIHVVNSLNYDIMMKGSNFH